MKCIYFKDIVLSNNRNISKKSGFEFQVINIKPFTKVIVEIYQIITGYEFQEINITQAFCSS